MPELNVAAIPAFADNYIWLVSTGVRQCAVVDPGDAEPVLNALRIGELELTDILLTHHHPDHTGGVEKLVKETGASVYGPDDPRVGPVSRAVRHGETLELRGPGLAFEVIGVPGHTTSHIAFFGYGCLFCGDTLFSVGCGRLFEGTPAQMQGSLDRIGALPGETRVFCAHEYTLSNCDFALAVEPNNTDLLRRASEAEAQRAAGRMTLPTTLDEERRVNPFLRTREPGVVAAAQKREPGAEAGASTLAVIRAWKDGF